MTPDEAYLTTTAHMLGVVYSPKVARVRAEIAAGTYETDEKHDIAADRLLDDLRPGEQADRAYWQEILDSTAANDDAGDVFEFENRPDKYEMR